MTGYLKTQIVLIVTLLLYSLPFALYPSPAFAQTPAPSSVFPSSNFQLQNPSSNFQLPTSISPTSPLYTDLLVHNIFHTFSCLAVGQSVIGQPCLTYQFQKNAQGMMQGIPVLSSANLSGGTLGAVTGLIAGLYQNPPVRTYESLASLGQTLGIVKEANAQGVVGSGAGVLQPIQTLWQVSRNIAYIIMIVIFVVIGMMIIFRQKINPQTVITAQAALPGLVIGLILITFSYFLAGLISDTAFLGTNMVGYYFAAAQGKTDDPERINLVKQIAPKSVLGIFSKFVGIVTLKDASGISTSIYDSMEPKAQNLVKLFVGWITSQFISPFSGAIPPPAGLFLKPVIDILVGGIAGAAAPAQTLGLVIWFAAGFILMYQMLMLFIRLLNSYLTIIFMTITAPFQFLFSSLPGRQGIATDWIMNLLGNVLVFPAVIAVLYFAALLLSGTGRDFTPLKTSQLNQIQNNGLVQTVYAEGPIEIIGTNTFPLFGGIDFGFVKILLAFGALIALPAIPDIVVKSIGKVGQAGQLIGQEITGGIRSGQGYANQVRGAVGGQLGGANKALFGQSSGPVWNPSYVDPVSGETVGRAEYPRIPGLIR